MPSNNHIYTHHYNENMIKLLTTAFHINHPNMTSRFINIKASLNIEEMCEHQTAINHHNNSAVYTQRNRSFRTDLLVSKILQIYCKL